MKEIIEVEEILPKLSIMPIDISKTMSEESRTKDGGKKNVCTSTKKR